MTYKQIIFISSEVQATEPDLVPKAMAKASMTLMSRMFPESKDFFGKSESIEYKKILQEWLNADELNSEVIHRESVDIGCIEFLCNMMGIPNCEIKHGDTVVCSVVGPWDENVLHEHLLGIE